MKLSVVTLSFLAHTLVTRYEAIRAVLSLVRLIAAAPPSRQILAGYVRQESRTPTIATPMNPPIVRQREMRIADITTWSLPNLLAWEDRNSMSHSRH
jgi:hypothetical protein